MLVDMGGASSHIHFVPSCTTAVCQCPGQNIGLHFFVESHNDADLICVSSGHSQRAQFWRHQVQAVPHGEHGQGTLQETRHRTLLGSSAQHERVGHRGRLRPAKRERHGAQTASLFRLLTPRLKASQSQLPPTSPGWGQRLEHSKAATISVCMCEWFLQECAARLVCVRESEDDMCVCLSQCWSFWV